MLAHAFVTGAHPQPTQKLIFLMENFMENFMETIESTLCVQIKKSQLFMFQKNCDREKNIKKVLEIPNGFHKYAINDVFYNSNLDDHICHISNPFLLEEWILYFL